MSRESFYLCTHAYARTHTHTHTHIHMNMHTHTRARMCTHTHTCIHTHVCTHIHAHTVRMHTGTHTRACMYTHIIYIILYATHLHTRTESHMQTHIHYTHTHAHTHAHTHTRTLIINVIVYNILRIDVFHKILLQYTYIALFRDKTDGSLRGITLLGVDRETVEGKKCTIIKVWLNHVIIWSCDQCSHQQVGLLLFKNAYHGGPLILLLMAYHLMKGWYNFELTNIIHTPIFTALIFPTRHWNCGKCTILFHKCLREETKQSGYYNLHNMGE